MAITLRMHAEELRRLALVIPSVLPVGWPDPTVRSWARVDQDRPVPIPTRPGEEKANGG